MPIIKIKHTGTHIIRDLDSYNGNPQPRQYLEAARKYEELPVFLPKQEKQGAELLGVILRKIHKI